MGFLSQTLFRAALSLNVITTKTRVSVINRSHFRASHDSTHRSNISKITMATSPQSQATCLLSFAWKAVARVIVLADKGANVVVNAASACDARRASGGSSNLATPSLSGRRPPSKDLGPDS